MTVTTRFATSCADCSARLHEPCAANCPARQVDTPQVPVPGAAPEDRPEVQGAGVIVDDMPAAAPDSEPPTTTSWLGEREGLSTREGAIVTLIVLGLSNQEIADALHISMHSTKTHIRSAYRKIGVASRHHATLWGVDHGFQLTAPAARLSNRG